jgi:eukaryotic-like serine/threonine-protein kinase
MTAPPKGFAEALHDRYLLERELGRGGMATVYLARDLRHNRLVGLKVLRPELAVAVGPDRFIREIRLTARLQHPHILPVFDSGEAHGRLWYSMPFVEGESLRARLNREGRLEVEDALKLIREVADALHYAHGQGIVHRDIKPENILLSQGHALVADFGIAQALEVGTGTKLTETGLALGTASYMSPEQASGGQVDARSDLYSLGCVMYELLAGDPPYTGASIHAIIAKRFTEPVPAVQRLRPSVPPAVATAVERALALAPAERFPSVAAFSSALEPSSGTIFPAARQWVRPRSRAPLLAAVAVAAALGLGIWLQSKGPARPGGTPTPVRLAVLPFENLGGSQAYLSDGIADGIRGKLAALPGVQVIAASSSDLYRNGGKPLSQVARELGVDHVVAGQVRPAKESASGALEVVPQLLDARTETLRSQPPYESSGENVLDVESDIAYWVAGELGLQLNRPEKVALSNALTRSPAAYDAYLRGLEARRQFEHESGPIGSAVALFRRAIELDSGFALAKVRLADALRSQAMISGDTSSFRQADSLLREVLRRQPDLAEAYVVQAEIRQYQDDRQGAYRLLLQAATLQKNNAFVLGRLAWLQATEGDTAAARTGAMAVALAPQDPEMLRRVIAGTSLFRHFDELTSYCDRLIELSPDDQMGYLNKALVQVWARGDTAGALQTLGAAERVMGRFEIWMVWPYAMAGPSGWKRLRQVTPAILRTSDNVRDSVNFYLWKARIARAERRSGELRADVDSVLAVVGRTPSSLPSFGTLMLARAYGYGVRGDRLRAARELAAAEAALGRLPASWRNQWGPDVAEVHALAGDTAGAEAEIRRTLKQPTGYTRKVLPLSPEFAWLWGTPRLDRLLADSLLP